MYVVLSSKTLRASLHTVNVVNVKSQDRGGSQLSLDVNVMKDFGPWIHICCICTFEYNVCLF